MEPERRAHPLDAARVRHHGAVGRGHASIGGVGGAARRWSRAAGTGARSRPASGRAAPCRGPTAARRRGGPRGRGRSGPGVVRPPDVAAVLAAGRGDGPCEAGCVAGVAAPRRPAASHARRSRGGPPRRGAAKALPRTPPCGELPASSTGRPGVGWEARGRSRGRARARRRPAHRGDRGHGAPTPLAHGREAAHHRGEPGGESPGGRAGGGEPGRPGRDGAVGRHGEARRPTSRPAGRGGWTRGGSWPWGRTGRSWEARMRRLGREAMEAGPKVRAPQRDPARGARRRAGGGPDPAAAVAGSGRIPKSRVAEAPGAARSSLHERPAARSRPCGPRRLAGGRPTCGRRRIAARRGGPARRPRRGRAGRRARAIGLPARATAGASWRSWRERA